MNAEALETLAQNLRRLSQPSEDGIHRVNDPVAARAGMNDPHRRTLRLTNPAPAEDNLRRKYEDVTGAPELRALREDLACERTGEHLEHTTGRGRLNMNVTLDRNEANERVMGIDALTVLGSDDRVGAAHTGVRSVATEILGLDEATASQLFDGPPDIGGARAWITPEDARRAVLNVARGETGPDMWKDADIAEIEARYAAESQRADRDWDTHNGRVSAAAIIDRSAAVERGVTIGGARIGAGAIIRSGARIDDGATIGEGAVVHGHSRVHAHARMEHGSELGPNAGLGVDERLVEGQRVCINTLSGPEPHPPKYDEGREPYDAVRTLTVDVGGYGPPKLPAVEGLSWQQSTRTVVLDSDAPATLMVRGNDNANAERCGKGFGDAIRTGSGEGNAVRRGEGFGHARRSGTGRGEAERTGRGNGDAVRAGTGAGGACRDGTGRGNAIRCGAGDGNAWHKGEGNGYALRSGSGNGEAVRTGRGAGNAERTGDGVGHARADNERQGLALRRGSGFGHAIRGGKGEGSAIRTGRGNGNAAVQSLARRCTNAIRDGGGNGHAVHNGDAPGWAIAAGSGNGSAVRRSAVAGGHALRTGSGSGDAVTDSPHEGNASREGDGAGSAVRDGDGAGHARRCGRGDGGAWRKGAGDGEAVRKDSGSGSAVRTGSGEGSATCSSRGRGDAIRDDDGPGEALRIGDGPGDAMHAGTGRASRLGSGEGLAVNRIDLQTPNKGRDESLRDATRAAAERLSATLHRMKADNAFASEEPANLRHQAGLTPVRIGDAPPTATGPRPASGAASRQVRNREPAPQRG